MRSHDKRGRSPQRGGRAPTGGTLRVDGIPNARTLDPHYSVEFAERHVMYAVYNPLVAVNAFRQKSCWSDSPPCSTRQVS